MVVKAALLRMRVTEVPTTLVPAGRSRPPHLRTWRDGWRHLRFMFLFSPRWLFLYPGLVLMAAGILGGAWLVPGPRRIGGVTFDIHTLLYSALAVLSGFQAVLFAVFSRVFVATSGLVPAGPRLGRMIHHARLEVGLILGTLLVIAGIVGTIVAVLGWGRASFGNLEPTRTFRTMIPAVLALALGGQVILGSFFLSVLSLNRRDPGQP
jgi:hypothetical protein